jgi:hypothetical protein
MEMNVLAAAVCAMEMQQRAGKHTIPRHKYHHHHHTAAATTNDATEHTTTGQELCFRIHCGLACGVLESEVFQAKNTTNHMQRLYHSVGGDPIDEIGELVALAGPGEGTNGTKKTELLLLVVVLLLLIYFDFRPSSLCVT